jgi:predicted oxidoreductase
MQKKLIAGTMRWGSWGARMSQQDYTYAIQKWIACGVHTFDLANLYGDYSCEKEFGSAFKQTEISRHEIRLISKMGIENPNEIRGNRIKHYNYSKQHIIDCAEQSLKDLQTDYLDLLLLHRPSPLLIAEEVAEAVSRLIAAGKINAFGVSNFLPSQIELLAPHIPIVNNQISFSLADFESMENGNLEAYSTQGLQVDAYSPIFNLEKVSSELRALLALYAKQYNCTEACVAVAWVLKHPLISSAVIGTSQLERMQEIRRALDIELSTQDYFSLWEAARGTRVP